jgi:hypothetical protein
VQRGSLITLEGRRRDGALRWAFPHYLVAESADLVSLFIPVGSSGLAPAGRGAFWDDSPPRTHRWHSHDVLRLTPLGAWHSVDCFYRPGQGFAGWYVNFQAPIRPTAAGFVTRDLDLDIWVEPDRSWRWKDRDEFADSVRLGHISPDEAAAVEAESALVIERCQRGAEPFDGTWTDWRPDPAWRAAELPAAFSITTAGAPADT